MTPPKKLSILQVCHDAKGPFIGVCSQYARAFKDHDVTTVFLKGESVDDALDRIGGNRVIFLEEQNGKSDKGLRGLKLHALYGMAKLLKRNHFDIAIAHRYKALYVIGVMSLFFSIPRILAVAHEYNMFLRFTRRLFMGALGKKILVAGVSEVVTKDIALRCPALMRQNRLITLYNTTPKLESDSYLTKVEARRKLGLSDSGVVIGTIGRLIKKKNQKLLIQAYAELGIQKSELLIIGGGPEASHLHECASDLGVEASVVFAGHRTKAYQFLNAFDVFVLPSGPEEAFGIVLLEAMQAKVTIVSSDVPGPKEVLGSGATLFDSGSAHDLCEKLKITLARTEEERQALIKKGYERLEDKFGEARFKSQLFRVLDISC